MRLVKAKHMLNITLASNNMMIEPSLVAGRHGVTHGTRSEKSGGVALDTKISQLGAKVSDTETKVATITA